MNRRTQSNLRKFKTTTGEYIWEPPATLGAQATLMNFPVVEAEDMPDIAADSLRSPSAISAAAMSWSTGSGCAFCAISIPRSLT